VQNGSCRFSAKDATPEIYVKCRICFSTLAFAMSFFMIAFEISEINQRR